MMTVMEIIGDMLGRSNDMIPQPDTAPTRYVTTIARRFHDDQLSDLLYSGTNRDGAYNYKASIERKMKDDGLNFDPQLADTIIVRTIRNYTVVKIESLSLITLEWTTSFELSEPN